MTKEELREHCEKQVKKCEEWAKGNGREPSGTIYEKYKLILDLIKALEQQPCDDVMAIHTQGLDEDVRCAMCTNSMKSDSGCDGGCVVDDGMYKKVMDTINKHIFSQPSEDCVSRKAVAEIINRQRFGIHQISMGIIKEKIESLPPVTPTQSWISVSEKLPENEGLYLVSVENDHQRQYSKTCWFSKPRSWFARQDVIAWQPLPKPYEEKRGSEND